MRRVLTCSLIALLALPAFASAAGKDVIADCNDNGVIDGTYTQAEYAKALKDLPADLDEYTDCRAVIKRARLRGAGADAASPGGSTSTKPSPRVITPKQQGAIQRDLNSKTLAAAKPLQVGEVRVNPDSLSSSSSLPAPLIVVVVLAAIGGAVAGAIAIRRFVLSHRDH